MSNQPQSTPTQKKSKGSSTSKPAAVPPDILAQINKLLEPIAKLIEPVADWIAQGENCDEDDIRLNWTVEAVRGKNTLYSKVTGSSVLTGIVSPSQLHLAAEIVEAEVIAKIAGPLAGKFQDQANLQALSIPKDFPAIMPAPSFITGLPLADKDIAVDAELISQQGEQPS